MTDRRPPLARYQRYRFDGTDEPARARDDAVVVVQREKPHGKADHAGGVPEHTVHGQIGLAGNGWADHGPDSAGIAANRHGCEKGSCEAAPKAGAFRHPASGLLRDSLTSMIGGCDVAILSFHSVKRTTTDPEIAGLDTAQFDKSVSLQKHKLVHRPT